MTHFLYFTPMLIEYNLCVLRNLLLKVKYTTKELYIYNKKGVQSISALDSSS